MASCTTTPPSRNSVLAVGNRRKELTLRTSGLANGRAGLLPSPALSEGGHARLVGGEPLVRASQPIGRAGQIVFVKRDRAVIAQAVKSLLPFLAVSDLVAIFVKLQNI
jgi:hypothetical protein